jgi:multidrug efflux pump
LGYVALSEARDELLRLARADSGLSDVRESALAPSPQVQLDIDRAKANALGVGFTDIGAALATAVGSTYINDFPNQGRMQRVVVQAQGDQRSQVDDLLAMTVRNSAGQMLPLAAVVRAHWSSGPVQLTRYNGYPSINLSGSAASGRTTGQAMQRMEQLVATLPAGIGLEWTGLSQQEQLSGSQAPLLLGLALLVVFLCLAALYESWSIPAVVVLVIPLGVIGATLAVTLRGMPNDVFFKVGLITTIGLAAKNAILIVDVARHLYATGHSLIDAATHAARLRLRPIVMTSLAFILGVVPLVFATGAGSAALQAIGTGVIGGMITATVAVVFVPLFYVVIVGRTSRASASVQHPAPTAADL